GWGRGRIRRRGGVVMPRDRIDHVVFVDPEFGEQDGAARVVGEGEQEMLSICMGVSELLRLDARAVHHPLGRRREGQWDRRRRSRCPRGRANADQVDHLGMDPLLGDAERLQDPPGRAGGPGQRQEHVLGADVGVSETLGGGTRTVDDSPALLGHWLLHADSVLGRAPDFQRIPCKVLRRMFSKVLIANRGEIAVRIMRACEELGVATVAVYSELDRDAIHVARADEAYLLGPGPASESYLNVAKIIEVINQCGAEAVHPGYGFLAENAAFAAALEENGTVFIGPPASAIEAMGSKTRARELMQEAGVPIVPGTTEPVETIEDAEKIIDETIGYPVAVKAAGGGGGKGFRVA